MILEFLGQASYFLECLIRLAELEPKLSALYLQCVLQLDGVLGNRTRGVCSGSAMGQFEPGFAWPRRASQPLHCHYELQGCATCCDRQALLVHTLCSLEN